MNLQTNNAALQLAMPPKVGFNKPPEPKFIREMKAKLGYRSAFAGLLWRAEQH